MRSQLLSLRFIARLTKSVLYQLPTSGRNQLLISRHFEQQSNSASSVLTATLGHLCFLNIYASYSGDSTHRSGGRATKEMLNHLPFFACGEIVKGFGRGSKELGIPTANYALEVVKALPAALSQGVYYGWANVDNGEVYKMVMSIGTNPYYDNKEKSMETHIMHDFNCDLYGRVLKVCIVGHLRPELNYKSLDELIAAIRADIRDADQLLDSDSVSLQLKHAPFFKECNNSGKFKTPKTNGECPKNGS